MKLLIISETFEAGVGQHIVDIVTAMSGRGHFVHLVYNAARTTPLFLQAIERLPGVACMAERMQRAPGPGDAALLARLHGYARRHGPFDVVHGQSSKGGALARLLSVAIGARCIYSPHAFFTMSPTLSAAKRLFYGAIERALSELTDVITCTSEFERLHAIGLGIKSDRLVVIHNGMDALPADDPSTLRATTPEDRVVIGFVGRLNEQKAPERLIEAAAPVLAGRANAEVVVIGDGPLRAALEAQATALGVAAQVRFLGPIYARPEMSRFDLLVVPSRYEGFAYVLLEALHARLPIVTTPIGGAEDTVTDGVNGFIVAQNDAAALRERIERLVADPALRRRMSAASAARAGAFTIARMADALERIYSAGASAASGVADQQAA